MKLEHDKQDQQTAYAIISAPSLSEVEERRALAYAAKHGAKWVEVYRSVVREGGAVEMHVFVKRVEV